MADKAIVLQAHHFDGLDNLDSSKGDGQDLRSQQARLASRLQALMTLFPGALFGGGEAPNPLVLADRAGASVDVTVTSAKLGDFCIPLIATSGVAGLVVSAYVKSDDIVTVRFENGSGASVDLSGALVGALVIPLSRASYYGRLGSVDWDPASLSDGAGESKAISVDGAKLGDFALVSLGVNAGGAVLLASVTANDTVTARLQNETGGVLDLASSRARALVIPHTHIDNVVAVGWDPPNLADTAGVSVDVVVPGATSIDAAMASFSVNTAGLLLSANVKSANLVTVRLQNETGAPVNLAAGTLRVGIVKFPSLVPLPALNFSVV